MVRFYCIKYDNIYELSFLKQIDFVWNNDEIIIYIRVLYMGTTGTNLPSNDLSVNV
jgi:hypothetical protein